MPLLDLSPQFPVAAARDTEPTAPSTPRELSPSTAEVGAISREASPPPLSANVPPPLLSPDVVPDSAAQPPAEAAPAGAAAGTRSVWARGGRKRLLSPREDKQKLHALLGLYCALHIVLRVALWAFTGTMRFDGSVTTLLSVAPHLFLALSSFRFHLPARRSRLLPVIYSEWRLHTLFFSARSLATFALGWLALRTGAAWPLWLRGPVVVWALLAADDATKMEGVQSNGSLMRSMPWPEHWPKAAQPWLTTFYAVSQLMATVGSLVSYRLDASFAVLAVIQLAAFLATLCRKGFLSCAGWHVAYAALLAGVYLIMKRSTPILVDGSPRVPEYLFIFPVVFVITSLRTVGVDVSKYVLWGAVVALHWGVMSRGALDRVIA